MSERDPDAMIAAVEGDVQYVARWLCARHKLPIGVDDVAQELRIYLLRIVDRWDPERAKWRTHVRNRLPGAAIDIARSYGYVNRHGKPQNDVPWGDAGSPMFSRLSGRRSETDVDWDDLCDAILQESDHVQMFVAYALGETMAEIGRRYGMSESRVSQILSPKSCYREQIVARLRVLFTGSSAA